MPFELYRKLDVLPKARDLILMVYKVTSTFPRDEQFGLISQLRRATVSIATNICEGKGRESDRELIRFLLIARGSIREVQFLLLVSRDLGYVTESDHRMLNRKVHEIDLMIGGMLKSLKSYPVLVRTRKENKPQNPRP